MDLIYKYGENNRRFNYRDSGIYLIDIELKHDK